MESFSFDPLESVHDVADINKWSVPRLRNALTAIPGSYESTSKRAELQRQLVRGHIGFELLCRSLEDDEIAPTDFFHDNQGNMQPINTAISFDTWTERTLIWRADQEMLPVRMVDNLELPPIAD